MSDRLNLDRRTTNFQLTPRGRLIVRLLLISGVVGVIALLASLWLKQPVSSAVAAEQQDRGVYQTIVVQPGDTLWEISSRVAQGNDRAHVLEQIRTYNKLETSDLQPGQTLYVPLTRK